ncbi:MAG: pilus assembly protein PilM [Paludibacter sp.]|nr:pilus assembly protein PilM [Bacteroidales bacterium]MCM1069205.1 pilus assembly protein PilM [Prevotella sp.]MCM1354110.1 pilus assembly protein PilM [Bacteroides sp.]MCM1442917.1 pilus assembly protein PilM [Muribaculum sp.]MCM1481760.1 pilus assembly protein PilM [Paludibacter sp.]
MKERIHTKESMPLVAIDMGSSAIRAMAAIENADKTLHILGVESISNYKYMAKGVVKNTSDAGFLIGDLLLKLKNRIGLKDEILSVFVTVGGTVQATMVPVKRNLINKQSVTEKLLKAMETEVVEKIEKKYPQLKVTNVEPITFELDGIEQDYPPTESQKVKELQITYNVFIAKEETMSRMVGAFARTGRSIDFLWAQPYAHMTALAGNEDHEYGCAIIDFGAQTTTLTICKNDSCLFAKVYPLGGYNITRDLQSQQIQFEMAEKAKVVFGAAAEKYVKENRTLRMRANHAEQGQITVTTQFLAMIIQSRLSEIVMPIMAELKNYETEIAKIYVTGGGALLTGLVPFLQQYTTLPVVFGSHADWLELDAVEEYYKPEYSSLVGTLALAADYRKRCPQGVLLDSPIKKGRLKRVKDTIEQITIGFFTND